MWRVNVHCKRQIAFISFAGLAFLLAGCHKKRPQVPAQAQAPTITAPATIQPQPTQPAPQPSTPTTTAPSTAPAQQQTAPTPKPKPKRANRPAKHTPTEQEKTATKKVIPAQGSADNTVADISVGMNQTEAVHERETTEKLLQSTEANLNGLNRTLTSDEAAMAEEVRNYMAQARQAMNDGDLIRANNLAMKAHLLSDALVKH